MRNDVIFVLGYIMRKWEILRNDVKKSQIVIAFLRKKIIFFIKLTTVRVLLPFVTILKKNHNLKKI